MAAPAGTSGHIQFQQLLAFSPREGYSRLSPIINSSHPSEAELRQVFRRGRALALRYSAPLTSPVGKLSYHVVYANPVYGLDQVSRQSRQNVCKGIAYAGIEPISFTRLAGREGWALRQETLVRQGRTKAETEAWWKRLCLSAKGLPGFEAWGASHGGKLVAALIAFRTGDCILMAYQQSLTAHMRFGVNNALAFVFTQEALARPGVKKLFYGLESLDASWEVDEFKLRMGYSLETVRQRVVFHPALRPMLKPATHWVLNYLGGRCSGTRKHSKRRVWSDSIWKDIALSRGRSDRIAGLRKKSRQLRRHRDFRPAIRRAASVMAGPRVPCLTAPPSDIMDPT